MDLFPHILLLSSDASALDSFLLLPKKLRPAYTLFSQCEWVAKGRSQDTQGIMKGPTCRPRLVSTSTASSCGTDLAHSKLPNPTWCV